MGDICGMVSTINSQNSKLSIVSNKAYSKNHAMPVLFYAALDHGSRLYLRILWVAS